MVSGLKKRTTYAVVDIETTGTNPKTDRIIQFGCVLIENGEIVSRFATDVNPNQSISKQIQNLTGITNQRARKAPFFEDVAETIFNLLADTVFVAHNIYFDYSFLSHELVRCGMPELALPGIDTVELAQIFLPTEGSYRLGDLATSLNLVHDNPHQADSDALVTAELLLLIEAKMRQLPLITMETIAELSEVIGADTGTYIKNIVQSMRQDIQPLSPELQVVEGIVLRKKTIPLYEEAYYEQADFPKSKRAKERVFNGALSYRPEQAKMMNLVYEHFTESELTTKNLFIEAATGTGKTLGYLFPMSYFATPEQPIIISTVSLVLQSQIMEKDIPLVNQFAPKPLQGVLVKGYHHYLDLQRFQATLKQPVLQKQYGLYQMRVLVWLTETSDGDLDELHLTSYQHLFFNDVTHRGVQYLSDDRPLYKEDFLLYLHSKMKQSNVLVVNHALLAHESRREVPLLPSSPYLLIDEAHHLPDVLSRIATHQIYAGRFNKRLMQMQEAGSLLESVKELLTDSEELRLFRLYQSSLIDLSEEFLDFCDELIQIVLGDGKSKKEQLLEKAMIDQFSIQGEQRMQKLEILFGDLLALQQRVQANFQLNMEKYTTYERIRFLSLFDFFHEIEDYSDLFDVYINQWDARWVKWLSFGKDGQAILSLSDFQASFLPETDWYGRYERVIFTGGTLKAGKDKRYLAKKLGLEEIVFRSLANPYDYSQQARMYIPEEALAIRDASSSQFAYYISSVVEQIAQEQDRPILVLFTAHEILSKVYQNLHMKLFVQGREVLAQGMNGSREKVLKRFFHSDNSILLGADSFWEGVDLPGNTLQLLIVTRLPFENPQRPYVKAYYEYLESEGINPFFKESLPKATLRLRQGLGRLIRSETDRGVLVVLDRRLVTAKYGKQMLGALPKELPVKEAPLAEILAEMDGFLEE